MISATVLAVFFVPVFFVVVMRLFRRNDVETGSRSEAEASPARAQGAHPAPAE